MTRNSRSGRVRQDQAGIGNRMFLQAAGSMQTSKVCVENYARTPGVVVVIVIWNQVSVSLKVAVLVRRSWRADNVEFLNDGLSKGNYI